MSSSEQAGGDYLIVRVGDECYALPSPAIREVARWRPPTPVPGAPAVLPGIISQRGVVLPAVDLRLLLGVAADEPGRMARYVIVAQEPADLALIVDAAVDLRRLEAADLSRPPAGLDPHRARMLSAVTRFDEQPLLLIDLAALIAALQEGA